ncbi:MAG: hypothetical protein AAFW69_11080, partial [Pseudomonadota bacterium]
GYRSVPAETGRSDATIQRNALEICQHRAQQPCYLYVVNDAVVWSEDDEAVAVEIQYGGAFDPSRIPFVSDKMREEGLLVHGRRGNPSVPFGEAPANRAFAMSALGIGHVWIDASTESVARREALLRCTRFMREIGFDGPCFVYAINERVVFSPSDPL